MNGGSPEPTLEPFDYGSIPPYEYPVSPIVDVAAPEQPKKSKPELKRPPHGPPPPKPFIERVSPVTPVAPEKQPDVVVVMAHPEMVQLPEVQKPISEVQAKPEVGTSNRKLIPPKPEAYSSDQKKKPPKPEEKASKPEVGSSNAGSKNKKGRKFNGAGGRIHTEAHIDRILDEYILTGNLPTYVSDRQRYDYRHHIRLPERRKFLGKQQTATGNAASGTSATAGTQDNISHFPGTGTHDS